MAKNKIGNRVLIRNLKDNDIYDIIKESFLTYLDLDQDKGSVFVVKPNLGFKTNSKGGTTDLILIENVLKIINKYFAPKGIYLAESDGIAYRCEDVFGYLDMDKLCQKYNAETINLSKQDTEIIRSKKCVFFNKFRIPKLLNEQDVKLINLPKIKTHEISRFSGAIKNLYGLNPYIFKVEYHPFLDKVLHDIYYIFKTDLNIVDGIWAINGRGPWMGYPVNLNTIISGRDALLVDIQCLKCIRWDVNDVKYIKKLHEENPYLYADEDGNIPNGPKFEWIPPSKSGLIKENLARALVPLFKRGLPLVYYSHGAFRLVLYSENGEHCKSIRSFPKQKG
jgi:uncharacterized protein (DUF362 family)